MKKRVLGMTIVFSMILSLLTNGLAISSIAAANEFETMSGEIMGGSLESFQLHKSYHRMDIGKTATFSIIDVVPTDTSTSLNGLWSSSNPSIVKMTGNAPGQVKALAKGTAVITCDISGIKASVAITVGNEIPVSAFALTPSRETIEAGETLQLSFADVLPLNATNLASARWFSSNSDVVSFTNTPGELQTNIPGYSTITCMVGSVKAYAKIFVVEPSEEENELSLVKVTEMMFDLRQEDNVSAKLKLFDEYAKVLDASPMSQSPYLPPIDSQASSNANTWRSPGANWDVDHTVAKIDMARQWKLMKIFVFDGPMYAPSTYTADGSAPYEVMGGTFKVFAGETLLLSYDLENSGMWVEFDLTDSFGIDGFTTQQLDFVKEQDESENGGYRYSWSAGSEGWTSPKGLYVCDANVVEVAMYGIPLGDDPIIEDNWELQVDGRPVTDFQIPFNEFVGTNTFYNENRDSYEAIGFVREYHNWGWTEYAANDVAAGGVKNDSGMTLDPDVAFINSWGVFDAYYQNLQKLGVKVSICIQGGVLGATHSRPDYQGDQDPKKASSYLAHSQSLFQHAARYGNNKTLDPNLVKVAPGTDKQIGMGLVEYYENWNEPNLGSFTGAQFAAMTSADYDGHMGTMGPGAGLINADPNAKLVLGGLAGMIFEDGAYGEKDWTCTAFLKDMLKWFDINRSEEEWLKTHDTLEGYVKYPFDVLNCHYYCPDGNAATGLSPEEDRLYERLMDFMEFRALYLPDKEIWMSEFGWDSSQGSPQSATIEYTKNGTIYNEGINVGLDGKEVQGRWLVREYLMMAAAGLDRVQQFMMPNSGNGEGSSGRFDTCGMLDGYQGSSNYKPSWYYVGTMKYYLNTTQFDSVIEKGGNDGLSGPWVLKFNETMNDDSVFALWLPTSLGDLNGENIEHYSLKMPDGTQHATLVTMKNNVKWGELTVLDVIEGFVTVPVTEKPVFVITSVDDFYKPVPAKLDPRTFTVNKLTTSYNDPAFLFDEQDVAIPINSWGPAGGNRYAIIDLQAKYNLSSVSLFDRENSLIAGSVFAVYAGDIGEWEPNFGNETGTGVQAQLANGNWTLVATHNFGLWETWYTATFDVEARYIIVGFQDGENNLPWDQWQTNHVGIQEMKIYGTLAKGETAPEPWRRSFEPKPSAEDYTFYYDNSFVGSEIGVSVSAATSELVSGTKADGTAGNVLKLTGTGSFDVELLGDAVEDLVPNTWYFVDYKFMIEDNFTAPMVYFIDNNNWRTIVSREGDRVFKPIWGGNDQKRTVAQDEWHRMQVRFLVDDNFLITYQIFYDEMLVGGATISGINMVKFPMDSVLLRMNPGSGVSGVAYFDDIWVYTKNPSDYLVKETFNNRNIGSFTSGNGLVLDGGPTLKNVIQPVESDDYYLGEDNKIIKLTGANPQFVFSTADANVWDEMKTGDDLVLDYFFYAETKEVYPYVEFISDSWRRTGFIGQGWGDITVVSNGVWDTHKRKPISEGEWHRVAVKFTYVSLKWVTYSVYIDDMETAFYTGEFDHAKMSNVGADFYHWAFIFGISTQNTSLSTYMDDVFMYRGNEIRNPEKKLHKPAGEPTPTPIPTPDPTPTPIPEQPEIDYIYSQTFEDGSIGSLTGMTMAGSTTYPTVVVPTAGDTFYNAAIGNVMKIPTVDMWGSQRAGFLIPKEELLLEAGVDYIFDMIYYSDVKMSPSIGDISKDGYLRPVLSGQEWEVRYGGGAIGISQFPKEQWIRLTMKFHVTDVATSVEFLVNGVSTGVVTPSEASTVSAQSLLQSLCILIRSYGGQENLYVGGICLYTGTEVAEFIDWTGNAMNP